MTCRTCSEAILDLARGVPVPSPGAEEAQAHLAECATCTAGFRQQRDLTLGLVALAAATRSMPVPSHLEERLRERFECGRRPEPVSAPHRHVLRWAGLAAAAALAAMVFWASVIEWAPALVPPAPEPAAGSALPHEPPSFPGPGVTTPAALAKGAVSSIPRAKGGTASRTRSRPMNDVRPIEFVALPDASTLPPIESARIVRTEVPVSALTDYGIAVVPAPERAAVAADLLVGQDGLPRAIRLVTTQHHR